MNENLHIAIHAGYSFIMDICCQIHDQSKILKERKRNNEDNRSLKSTITLMSFNMLEGYANFLSTLTLALDSKEIVDKNVVNKLDVIERNILKEEEGKYNFKKCRVENKKNAFIPTLDKIKIVLTLFSKIYDEEYRLEIGVKYWEDLKSFKDERDKLTHMKFDMKLIPTSEEYGECNILEKVKPTFNIEDKALIDGIIAVRWYFTQSALQLQNILKEEISKSLLSGLDIFLFKLISDLNEALGVYITKSDREKHILPINNFETEYMDNVENTLYMLTRTTEEIKLIDPIFDDKDNE